MRSVLQAACVLSIVMITAGAASVFTLPVFAESSESRTLAFDAMFGAIVFGASQHSTRVFRENGYDHEGLIMSLAYIDTDESRRVLVKLSSIYMGDSAAEAVVSAITHHGDKILPDLVRALEKPQKCNLLVKDQKAEIPHCLTEKEHQLFLNDMIKYIRRKEIVEYVW